MSTTTDDVVHLVSSASLRTDSPTVRSVCERVLYVQGLRSEAATCRLGFVTCPACKDWAKRELL